MAATHLSSNKARALPALFDCELGARRLPRRERGRLRGNNTGGGCDGGAGGGGGGGHHWTIEPSSRVGVGRRSSSVLLLGRGEAAVDRRRTSSRLLVARREAADDGRRTSSRSLLLLARGEAAVDGRRTRTSSAATISRGCWGSGSGGGNDDAVRGGGRRLDRRRERCLRLHALNEVDLLPLVEAGTTLGVSGGADVDVDAMVETAPAARRNTVVPLVDGFDSSSADGGRQLITDDGLRGGGPTLTAERGLKVKADDGPGVEARAGYRKQKRNRGRELEELEGGGREEVEEDNRFMRMALRLAERARLEGEVPVRGSYGVSLVDMTLVDMTQQ